MAVKEVTQTPLKPLEIKRDPCPNLRKISAVFFISVSSALLGWGVAITLTEAVVVVIGGGVIGLVVGLILARILLKKELPPIQQYRIQTLHQIANDQPQLKSLIENVKQVFFQKQIAFKWAGEHHALHDHCTRITLSNSMKERAGLKEVWKKFLENSSGIEVSYPQGPKHQLDFSLELERLEGRAIPLKVELLNPLSPAFEEDLKRIFTLLIDADSRALPIEPTEYDIGLRQRFTLKTPSDQCILIRREGSQELLGMLWYEMQEKDHAHICALSRNSRAAQLQIGNRLFAKLYEMVALDKNQISLRVRSKNAPALKLYKNQFFDRVHTEKGYYHFPIDDAIFMRFNYAKYQAAQLAQPARHVV